eukprot:CAMPEP_0202382702 /NCGR_PEP_ID=MMETSP1127-20130417/44664_1 /ASSEMBLY_ACC=CAM_ASM_000462 /TAXON_ID=3047 /ORGANISM="Dunaliella tertiolecta, Strain CCMP1320" /LENGTH=329 /DNA_ID=CAMNT_0048981963 /DNA_START=254 /DNA_END=1243 /DNA_ORIENTATION=+
MPTVEVDAACSSPIRNQSLPGSACSSPAGANHVIVLVGHAHNGEGGGGAGAGVNASQDTRAASRPQHEENSQGGGGETRAGDNGGAAVGDGKQGLLEQASFKKKGSTERAPPSQKGADDRPLSAGMTECRICLSTDDAEQMVSACSCSGTQKWAHISCLSKWVVEKRNLTCELCNTPYSEPYSALLQQELNKHPARHGDAIGSLSLAGQADGAAPNAAAMNSGGAFSTPLTNPWSRIDYWLTLLALLAALIIILYFASRNWQVIVWGVIVGFVPITAGLSLLYMLVGKAVENHRWRQREAEERAGRRRRQRDPRVDMTLSPFMGVGMHM